MWAFRFWCGCSNASTGALVNRLVNYLVPEADQSERFAHPLAFFSIAPRLQPPSAMVGMRWCGRSWPLSPKISGACYARRWPSLRSHSSSTLARLTIG